MIFSCIVVIILIALGGILSGLETAITAVSKAKLQILSKSGNHKAKILEDLRRDMVSLISTLLMCNTVVNVWSASLATDILIRFFGDNGVWYATILMSVLIILYAEIVPKIYAIYIPEKLSLFYAIPIKYSVQIFGPISRFLEAIAQGTLNILKISPSRSDDNNEIELIGAIDMHRGEDKKSQERKMLRSILDLDDVMLKDIMVHKKNVVTIDSSWNIKKIIEHTISIPYTRFPVTKEDKIVGILHTKTLMQNLSYIQSGAKDILSICSAPWFVPETTNLLLQLHQFRSRREHIVCIVDEYGRYSGTVSLEDILEEIVGHIDDEQDLQTQGITCNYENSYTVNGNVTIRDLNRECDIDISHKSPTVASWIIYKTKTLPKIDQTFNLDNLEVKILDVRHMMPSLIMINIKKVITE
jgi:Mg2+/Co2+ transporter CorB